VLGVGVLLIGFPSAYALVLTTLYLPVTLMLFGLINTAFSLLIALSMPELYVVLGAGCLMIKCEGALFEKCKRWGKNAMPVMGLSLLAISISRPLISADIAARWFVLPNIIGLAPIPLTTTVAFFSVYWALYSSRIAHAGYAWLVMAGTILMCVMAALGLAYSLYPYVVLNQLTIWESAAATSSLMFVYSVFRGKAMGLSYGGRE
jgi:cytochrome d ubiquinol oxidase subunit II